MWKNIEDELPPTGNCKENLLLLWTKCPDDIPYPEYRIGYDIGFYDRHDVGVFYDMAYRRRIHDVTHWMLLPTNPNTYLVKE